MPPQRLYRPVVTSAWRLCAQRRVFFEPFSQIVLVIRGGRKSNTKGTGHERITLKLPDDLNAALNEASRKRGLSKSAVVREALEQSLSAQGVAAGAAERWVARWQGRLTLPEASEVEATDPRLAHLLAKHVR